MGEEIDSVDQLVIGMFLCYDIRRKHDFAYAYLIR